jgi:hypothetical protein
MNTLQHDRSEINALFVHSEIDDYGLTTQEFRVYAHLARRAGKDGAYPSVDSMAAKCRINRDTAYECLKRLKFLNMIRATKRPGDTTIYTLTPRSQWKENPEEVSETEGYPLNSDTSYRKARDTQVSENRGYKGNPSEGTPLKDNTVVRQTAASPLSKNDSLTQAPKANGRSPNGDAAVFKEDVSEKKTPQAPIRKKAYAVAERLRSCHWDNCKVRFVKETARSYAEQALEDGHDEKELHSAYDEALHYCHRLATDEINQGKRHQAEKASPALTVYLSREHLKAEPRTVTERWEAIIETLAEKRQKAIEANDKVQKEIKAKLPEINEWFARTNNTRPGELSSSPLRTTPQLSPFPRHHPRFAHSED